MHYAHRIILAILIINTHCFVYVSWEKIMKEKTENETERERE